MYTVNVIVNPVLKELQLAAEHSHAGGACSFALGPSCCILDSVAQTSGVMVTTQEAGMQAEVCIAPACTVLCHTPLPALCRGAALYFTV